MDAKDIIHYKFLYILSKNLVPSQSKFKQDKKVQCIYKNYYPRKLKSQ